ncbi:type II toxin-antitoxin system HicB family antitoxin [Candidatus Micrarchaeota archaeon]|nr:type II toxin-antitoxin system HicB family antitoxin [Candidatus Micrarchaeota archaeon]
MEYKLSAIVEKEDKWYVAHCVELSVTSQGKNIEEALQNLKDAVGLYLKHADKDEIDQLKTAHKEAPVVATITV